MDVPTLSKFLSPIITVASIWNTGETGDICNLSSVVDRLAISKNFVIIAIRCDSMIGATFSSLAFLGSK